MSPRIAVLLTGAALLFVPTVAAAQERAECPEAAAEDGRPVELRIAGIVMRAQVKERPAAHEDGTSVEVRVVGCQEERGETEGDANAGETRDDVAGILRVFQDLWVGLELGPSEDGRCMRASFAVKDARPGAADEGGAELDEPIGLELCGLPFGRDSGAESEQAEPAAPLP